MTTEERIELLDHAEELLRDAIEAIQSATCGTAEEGRADLYIIGHLENWCENEDQIGSIPAIKEGLLHPESLAA